MPIYREKYSKIQNADIIEAVDSLFDKAYGYGLVEYKIAVEDRIDTINDMFLTMYKNNVITASEFEKLDNPSIIIDTIATRIKFMEDTKMEQTKNQKSKSLKQIFSTVWKEIKKSGDDQDEKVYFEAGRVIGKKIDNTAQKISGKVKKRFYTLFRK